MKDVLSPLTLCNTSVLTPSVQLFFSILSSTFQDSQGNSDQLSAVSKFQHDIMLCSKCSTVL